MRHPVWFRALIALWGVWFATALTEPAGILACPMHSGAAGMQAMASMHGAAAATTGADEQSAHHAHVATAAGHDDHGAAATSSDKEHDSSGSNCCTCLGQCCTMSPAVLPQSLASLELVVRDASVVQVTPHSTRLSQRVAHLLPFANGPPLAA